MNKFLQGIEAINSIIEIINYDGKDLSDDEITRGVQVMMNALDMIYDAGKEGSVKFRGYRSGEDIMDDIPAIEIASLELSPCGIDDGFCLEKGGNIYWHSLEFDRDGIIALRQELSGDDEVLKDNMYKAIDRFHERARELRKENPLWTQEQIWDEMKKDHPPHGCNNKTWQRSVYGRICTGEYPAAKKRGFGPIFPRKNKYINV